MNENEIIKLADKYLNNTNPDILKGIGDDCAVTLGSPKKQLYTSDMLIENTHFLFNNIPPYLLGWKSLAVNISDIASMGGVPKYALLSLGLNSKVDSEWLEEFYRGLSECADTYNMSVIGGDTVRSDQIIINIALTGECSKPIFRNGIESGDLIFSTGLLGLSGAGLWCIKNNIENPFCIDKHYKPIPRVQEGLFLNKLVNVDVKEETSIQVKNNISMMDSSDGLYKSIETLCQISDLGAEIYFENLEIHDELKKISLLSWVDVENFILYGGEDYELIFAISESNYQIIKEQYFLEFKVNLKIIGRFTKSKEINLIKNSHKISLKDNSFSHF